jgi:hypothetical protein
MGTLDAPDNVVGMSLDTALGTALGAVLSLVLFGISYRQTVGARRERIRGALAP